MKSFNTKQDVVLHLEALKEGARTLEAAVRATMDVVRKYDGKEFTRRITKQAQKAVDEALGANVVSVGFTRENGRQEVSFFLGKRFYIAKSVRLGREVTDFVYFDGELWRSLTRWDVSDYYTPVDADVFQKKADDMVRYNARLVWKYADAAERFDEYVLAYFKAVNEFQTACGAINPIFVENMVHTQDARVSRAWEERADEAAGIVR